MGSKIFTEETQTQREWSNAGVLTTAQVALTTDKSKDTVEALTSTGIAVVEISSGAPAMSFRFRTGANADSNVLNVYAMRGDDHYALIGTITVTGGTQVAVSGTSVFCDTVAITASTEVWPTPLAAISQTNNSIAEFALNMHGVSKLLFIATTLASSMLIEGVIL